MKQETFLGVIILIGIWLLTNWFKILITILLIIVCVQLGNINSSIKENTDELDFQINGLRSINSDIRDNSSSIKTNVSDIDYRFQYPSIIR